MHKRLTGDAASSCHLTVTSIIIVTTDSYGVGHVRESEGICVS